jgi:uncharacterized transporter YbjL
VDASTSTATVQAAFDVMKNNDPSIGYSIAYPFGVIVPILCIYFMTRQVQSKFPPKRQGFHMAEVTLGEDFAGRKPDEPGGDPPSGAPVTYYLLKIPKDDLVGVASGATGKPAILICSTRMALTERPDIGYPMSCPSMPIVKVVAVPVVGLMVATGAS